MTAPNGRWRVGPHSGDLIIRTFREGLAARAGHDLTIAVREWSADIDLPDGDPAVTATVDLGSLDVRDGTGGAMPLTDRDRRDITATARRILSDSGGPDATYRSTEVIPAGGAGGAIEGSATLHGTSRPVRLQVIGSGGERYRVTTTVRQSEFGIKPYTGLFGALKVRDAVEVEINVDLSRAEPR